MDQQPGQRVTVVNIISTSYSGSTWLNLLLGSHSQAMSVGIADRLRRMKPTICSFHGPDCPFWSSFSAGDDNLYLRIAQSAQKPMLVISNPRYTLPEQVHPLIHPRFLFLIRDGRAVVHSDMRKHPDLSTWTAARSWARGVNKKARMLRQRPAADVHRVSYEALRDNTEQELVRVCQFLGLAFEPAMLSYWTLPHHFLGGNAGSLSYAARGQGLSRVYGQNKEGEMFTVDLQEGGTSFQSGGRVERVDLAPYQQQSAQQFRDERWKSQMSNLQLRLFALAAGRTNRRFGYPSSLDRKAALCS
jgi:hypothetical protein